MKLGVVLPHGGRVAEQPGALRDVAVAAEDLGYASVWAGDHLALPAHESTPYIYSASPSYPVPADRKFLEPFTTLSHVAALTTTITLGLGVCILPYRRALELAKLVGTVDYLSGGRLTLGVGTGWLREEFEALGVPFTARGALTDDALEFLRACWSTDGPVTFEGRGYHVRDMRIEPRSYDGRDIPVWVGGRGNAALHRAARFGTAWHPPLFGADPASLLDRYGRLCEEARSADRQPPALTMFFPYRQQGEEQAENAWDRGELAGPVASLLEVLRLYDAIGVEHMVLSVGGGVGTRLSIMAEIAQEFLAADRGLQKS